MLPETRVLYNADCPVCRAEINHYAAYCGAQDLALRFDDLNGPDLSLWGIDADTAARRLHVLHAGSVTHGMPAFRILWAQMPRYRWLARLTNLPLVRPLVDALYDHILAPLLYRRHLSRVAKSKDKPNVR